MRNKLGILIVVAMVAASCGSGSSSDGATQSGANDEQPISADVADHHEGDEGVADHHDVDADVADHADDAVVADHHDGDADVADHAGAADAAGRIVEVSITEFSIDSPEYAATLGETVSFVVTNHGRVGHEFRLTTEHAAEEHVAEHTGDHADHMASVDDHHQEFFVMVAPGSTETLTVSFDHDMEFDVAGCLLPGHWEAGLHVPFAIES